MTNHHRRSKIRLVALGAALATVLAACSSGSSASNSSNNAAGGSSSSSSQSSSSGSAAPTGSLGADCTGTTINIGTNADANNINPILAVDLDGRFRTDLVFDPLVQVDPVKLTAVPALADSWTVSSDQKTYTFKLHPGVKFSDGTPLTAKDVAFTVMQILNPKYTGPFQKDWSRLVGSDDVVAGKATSLSGLKVIDDATISMTLKEPYAGFLTVIARQLKTLPSHLLANGEALDPASKFSLNPVGSGPYKFVSWNKGTAFKVQANDSYWGGAPCMKSITQTIIPDTNTLTAALQSGDIDASIIPPPSALKTLAGDNQLTIDQLPPLTAEGLYFNMRKEPWKSNAKLRQAIAYALDMSTFSKQFLATTDPKQASFYSSASWAYDSSLKLPTFDVAKAKQMLADAGYSNGGVTITIATNSGNAFRAQEQTYVQEALKAIGITVKLTSNDWATFIGGVGKGDFDVAALNGGDNAGVPDPTSLDTTYVTGGATNYSGYTNSKVDSLLAQAGQTNDEATRKGLYQQVQAQLAQDLPFLPTFWRPNVLVVKKSMKNVSPSVIGAYWNIQNWSNK